jgi:PiT family inorganic phosphate transporter
LSAVHSHAPDIVDPGRPPFETSLEARRVIVFVGLLLGGIGFAAWNIWQDLLASGQSLGSLAPYLLLGLALLIALGFEFVNGFHDTANAVATVIYTRSMRPDSAVMLSGVFNFLGALASTGAVAFGIISLLPVELILGVGTQAGFAMVFAMLIAAILWNLGTWWFGLPASSSHTLIGSIIGVGVANALMRGRDATSGVDWSKATEIGYALLLSPLVGFVCAALLMAAGKLLLRKPELYRQPRAGATPPGWIRAILVTTGMGVSFAHGSNDGQKGMGLIMLILIGVAPTAYALNSRLPAGHVVTFMQASDAALSVVDARTAALRTAGRLDGDAAAGAARETLTRSIGQHRFEEADFPALGALMRDVAHRVESNGSVGRAPAQTAAAARNDIYLASEAIRSLGKQKASGLSVEEAAALGAYKGQLDAATKFVPLWVKITVALALGLGTMVGWKRVVITVGEKIGASGMTYAQGAAAQSVAMVSIAGADFFGLPVSTTHVLSSGVAGAMAANGAGLQRATLRNLALAWFLTLPCAMALSGALYALLVALI